MTDTLPLVELSAYRAYHAHPQFSRFPHLGQHVAEHGVQDPVHVQTDGVHALIVDGNKRVAAACDAGLVSIPIVVDKVEFPWRHFVNGSAMHAVGPALKALLTPAPEPEPTPEVVTPVMPEKASARRSRR